MRVGATALRALAAAAVCGGIIASAAAGDLAALRRAVDAGDRGALQRWLVADAAAPSAIMPEAAARPPSRGLEKDGADGEAAEMQVHTLALLYFAVPDPALKSRLLAAIDEAGKLRSDLDRKKSAEKLDVARDTLRLSDISLAPRKGGVVVSFAYAGAAQGTELSARWLREDDDKSVEIGRSSARLKDPAGRAELGLDPAPAAGTLRVELLDRDRLVASRGFVRPSAAAPSPAAPPAPPASRAPAVASAPAPAPTAAATPARGRAEPAAPGPDVATLPARAAPAPLQVEIGDAMFAKTLRDARPTQALTETTTARRRLVLWLEATSNQVTKLGARWRDESGAALGESVVDLPAGKSEVAFWLATADERATFPRGKLRVEILQGSATLRTLSLDVKTAGLFDALRESLDDLGAALDTMIKGVPK